jgi:hypothetical protein
MKKNLFFLIFSLVLMSGKAADYYWNPQMGGIFWSDTSNWVTTSGGSINYGSIPGPGDNVYVDSNSSDVLIMLDDTARVHSVFFNGPFSTPPTIDNSFSGAPLYVYGSFYGVTDLNLVGQLLFVSSSPGNIIDVYNPLATFNPLTNLVISLDGTGEWTLANHVISYAFIVNSGVFNTNNKNIETSNFQVWGNVPRTVFFGTSNFICYDNGGFGISGSNYSVDTDSLSIDFKNGFFVATGFNGGDNLHFRKITIDTMQSVLTLDGNNCEIDELICYGTPGYFPLNGRIHKAEFYGGGIISEEYIAGKYMIYDTLILENSVPASFGSNSDYFFDADSIFVSDLFQVNSAVNDTISITENIGGFGNIMSLPSDTICFDFLKLRNINAVGSGYYFAGNNSINLGGNSGWTFTNCAFSGVGISSFENSGLKMYPNPASSWITIESGKEIRFCELYSITGQLVHPEIFRNSENEILIDMESLNNGLYMIRLITDNGIIKGKIAKQ